MQQKTSMVERMVDDDTQEISLRDVASRVFLRPKLLLFMLVLPPLIAVWFSLMVPTEWAASTKILIRYNNADSDLLKDIVPDARLGLSGATSAELIKSKPVVLRAIDKVGITQEDVYQKPFDMIMANLSAVAKVFMPPSSDAVEDLQQDARTELAKRDLIKSFQASLESSSKKASGKNAIEVLEKTSITPESLKLDELITLQVKSFNRDKVADMTNGLAQAFVDEYFDLYTKEAKSQFAYLDDLVKQEESKLHEIEQASAADLMQNTVHSDSGKELIARDVPILSSMANELMAVQAELSKAKQIYDAQSPKVTRLVEQVGQLKFQLKKQELLEISKQQIEQLKIKRYQAANRLNLYQQRMVPISIAEYATTPKSPVTSKTSRVLMSGLLGALLALMLATALIVMLNVTDPRIHFERDVSQVIHYPVIASIPSVNHLSWQSVRDVFNHQELAYAIMPLIAKLGFKTEQEGKVIVVAGLEQGDGSSLISLMVAAMLARKKDERVCIIDADFKQAGLTQKLQLGQQQGLVDVLQGASPAFVYNQTTNLHALGVGNIMQAHALGYYADQAANVVRHCKQKFTYTIVDVGTALNNYELLLLGQQADTSLLVVTSGQTRKGKLRTIVSKLEQSGLTLSGVVLNKTRNVLPKFLYNSL